MEPPSFAPASSAPSHHWQPYTHWQALQNEVGRRRAAQESAHLEAGRARQLTADLAAITEEIATLSSESPAFSVKQATSSWPLDRRPGSKWRMVGAAGALAGSYQAHPDWRPEELRAQHEALQHLLASGEDRHQDGRESIARRVARLKQTLEAAQAPTAQPPDESSDEDFHDPKYDYHFPEPRYSQSRHATTPTPDEVKLAATKLESEALRAQLNRALGVDDTGETAGSPEVGGDPLFEAFIIVGGGPDLAEQIKTACRWWKPSKAEEEYNLLAARTEAELLCIYPPSTDAERASLLQAFALPDVAVRDRTFSFLFSDRNLSTRTGTKVTTSGLHGTGRYRSISTRTACGAARHSTLRALCIPDD